MPKNSIFGLTKRIFYLKKLVILRIFAYGNKFSTADRAIIAIFGVYDETLALKRIL
jgi:hypothetical protein